MTWVEKYIEEWLRHRLVLQEMVALVPDEHIGFKPWENAISMGSLITHIVTATDMFVKTVKNGTFTPPAKINPCETMEEIGNVVRELTEVTRRDLNSIQDEQLEKELEFNGYIGTGRLWLETAKDHEIHHKGQLFTYARMVGVEKLPFMMIQPPKKQ